MCPDIFVIFQSNDISCFWAGQVHYSIDCMLTVSIRSENFAKIRLGFPEPTILNKCAEYFQVKISHDYMIVYDIKIMSTFRNNLITASFPEYGNF